MTLASKYGVDKNRANFPAMFGVSVKWNNAILPKCHLNLNIMIVAVMRILEKLGELLPMLVGPLFHPVIAIGVV